MISHDRGRKTKQHTSWSVSSVMPRSSSTVVDLCPTADSLEYDLDLDLRRDYQNAVDCLIQCDALFKTFQEQLLSKDNRIVTLEEKVMELSLELASIKAGQDYQKLKTQRGSSNNNNNISVVTLAAAAAASACTTTLHPSSERRKSWTSCWALSSSSSLENAKCSSNHKLLNLGQLVNKTLSLMAESRHPETTSVAVADSKDGLQHEWCKNRKNTHHNALPLPSHSHNDTTNYSRPWHHLERSQPPPFRRRFHRSPSSEKCLEALNDVENVIFPVSSFEVYRKGCCSSNSVDDRINHNGSTMEDASMQNVEWPTFG